MTESEKAQLFLKRFNGRTDVYGRKWHTKDGKHSGYAPVCDNFWKDACHIKLKDGVPCANCNIKAYAPVTEKSVLEHIGGNEQQIQYVLMLDNTVRFAALDFDMKPGKEDFGYTFDHVKTVTNVLKEWQVPHAVARSTTAGFHLYIFFDTNYPANRIRSFLLEVLDRSGILEYSRQGTKPTPEIFPKQSSGGTGGLGNGIKPPMIEPSMRERERNCWVDDNNVMIPVDLQWGYFQNIPSATPEMIDGIIEKCQIPIIELPVNAGRGHATATAGHARRGNWNPPLTGSIEKVLEGCKAMKRVKEKALKGEQLSHFEGFGLYHLAMNVADGEEWFLKNSGWGKDSHEMNQLEQSKAIGYNPWTCKKLQESGVCVAGTKCFDRKPPVEIIEGNLVERDDLPQDQWPEPSPVRYAYSKGDDFLDKLCREIDALKGADPSAIDSALADIAKRSQVFDSGQQSTLKEYIKAAGVIKSARAVDKRFKDAEKQAEEKFKATAGRRDDCIVHSGCIYSKMDSGFGYKVMSAAKGSGGKVADNPLCNFLIEILEESTIIGDDDKRIKQYGGQVIFPGKKYPFTMSVDDWNDNKAFMSKLKNICGSDFNPDKDNLDQIKIAAEEFSKREGLLQLKVYYSTQGWMKNAFLMPSVIIDKDGVRANEEKPVDLSGKEHAKCLDFRLLDDTEFKEVLLHLKNDFFNTFYRKAVFIGLGHTMLAPVLTLIDGEDGKTRPTMWFEGLTGGGKTGLALLLQQFYGTFYASLGWHASYKSMLNYGHGFKDCLLLVDDYKDMSSFQEHAARMMVQYSYQQSVQGALNRNGEQRGDKSSRCLFMATGEETPSNDAAFISRTVLVEYPKVDTFLTAKKFKICQKTSAKYSGITARFIHWVLQQDRVDINVELDQVKETLREPVRGRQNDSRVCTNLAMNYLSLRMFLSFMHDSGAIDHRELDSLCKEAFGYTEEVRNTMMARCSEEQGGNVFISTLVDLLMNRTASIRGLEGFEFERATEIGCVKAREGEPIMEAYFYPDVVVEMVKNHKKNSPLRVSKNAIASQLQECGILIKYQSGKESTSVIRVSKEHQGRWWIIDLKKLGLTKATLQPVSGTRTMDMPPVNADGIL